MSVKLLLKKYGVLVVISTIILLLFILIIVLLSKSTDDSPHQDTPRPSLPSDAPSEFVIVEQPLGYHKNYEINIPLAISNRLDTLQDEQYSGFTIKDIDHFSWVDKLVKDIGVSFSYSKNSPTSETTIHYWENQDDSISYNFNRDNLFLIFPQGIKFSGIDFNPKDENNVVQNLSALSKIYFSSDFSYKIKEISRLGNDYRVDFTRTLNNFSVHVDMQREYLILTPDGRLKEAMFLLVEFEESSTMQYSLISSSEFIQTVSSMEYPKSVAFSNLPSSVDEAYEPYGYKVSHNSFLQPGIIDVIEVDVVYLYSDKSQTVSVPTFLLQGSGTLDVEDNIVNADFIVLASAIESQYVFVHPQLHFQTLENAN